MTDSKEQILSDLKEGKITRKQAAKRAISLNIFSELFGKQAGEKPEAQEKDEKDVLIEQLAELGVKATRRSSVESLQAKLAEAQA